MQLLIELKKELTCILIKDKWGENLNIRSNYKANLSVQFKVLSDDQCQEILQASLEILERTGVEIKSDQALLLLKKAGAFIDKTRVRIPSFLIKKALSIVPSRVVLCDRYGNRKLFLEGYNSYFGPGPTNPYFLDLETGIRRNVLKQDVANTAKVCDALPNIDFVMSLAGITDCEPQLADVHEIHAMLQNTTKPIVGWANDLDGSKYIVEMCSAVAGSLQKLQLNPFLALYAGDPISPLIHPREALEKLLYMAELGLPVIYPPGLQLGGTAPVTIAGALAVGVADNLVGLLLTQLQREGSPYIGGAIPVLMDMSTTNTCYGAPEMILGHAAAADLYHYIGLPMWSTAGATDSKIVDEQAAVEAAFGCYTTALSGANLIHDVGFVESGMSGSLEQVVLADEIIGMARRIVAGVEVNKETLAVDVIDEVGPGGHFLGENHTFKHFKNDTWFPTLINRQRHFEWEQGGKKTMKQRLNEKAKKLLAQHEQKLLPQEIVLQLDKILERAKQKLKSFS